MVEKVAKSPFDTSIDSIKSMSSVGEKLGKNTEWIYIEWDIE